LEDKLLVARILGGDKGAFALVVERYKNAVFAVCMKYLRHREDAEDMAQEVFLAAYRKLPALEDGAKLRPWLLQIAKHRCLRELRKMRQWCEIPETLAENAPSPEDTLVLAEEKELLLAGLGALPEHLRAVVDLRYLHGLSTAATAQMLQIPEGTVKSRLFTGLSKLRKEVFGMTEIKEEKTKVSEDFVSKVMAMANSLRRYTRTDDFGGKYKTVMENIERLPDSKEKNEAKATALIFRSWKEKISDEDKKFIEENRTPACIIGDYIVKLLGKWDNYDYWFKAIPGYIEKARELSYPNGEGELRFWLGRAYVAKNDFASAYAEFEKASLLLEHENSYYPNSISAMRYAKKRMEHENNADSLSFTAKVCGETLTKTENRLYFVSQPGWSDKGGRGGNFSSIFYYASRVGDIFYDSSLAEGESIKDKNGDTLTCISRDRKVETAAGTFENCIVFFSDTDDGWSFTAEVAYKEGVGIVQCRFADGTNDETYELAEYNIAGGEGLLPLAVGNRWVYKNPAQPSYINESCEREIVFFDRDYAGFAALDFGVRDNDIEKYPDADARAFFERADAACDSMKRRDPYDAEKVESARRDFCRAVQLAENEREAQNALAALSHLEKRASYMRAGYRLLPSSVSMQTITKGTKNIRLVFRLNVCPFYDLGRRGYDNKIWGMKIYRYLQEFCGTLFDKRWLCALEGEKFEEKSEYGGEEVRITSEKCKAVATAAGIFRNCIAVTIEKGKQDGDHAYYWNNNQGHYMRGRKKFYFAPDVGIVKMECRWGDTLSSCTELSSYRTVSTSGEYMPFYYGMEWHYNETTFREKYVAEVNVKMVGGSKDPDSCDMIYEQNVYYAASEEEYEAVR